MRRIRRDVEHEEFLQELVGGDAPLFKDLWRILLFAAMLGFSTKRRIPLSSYDSGKAMPDSYFANSPVWPGILYLLGLVEVQDTSVMGAKPEDQDKLVTVFEEYANGGLHSLKDALELGSDRLKCLVDLCQAANSDKPTQDPDLRFEPL
jgi:dnd system-associated protein 4